MAPSDWTQYLTVPQRRVFATTLKAVLSARGLSVEVSRGMLRLGESEVALAALAATCADAPPLVWHDILTARIDEVLLSIAGAVEAEALDESWEAARHYIKLRLLRADEVEGDEGRLAVRVGADLAAVLVYDLPETVTSVLPEVPLSWPVSGEVLWQTAMDNLRAEPSPQLEQVALTEQSSAAIVSGESYFIASRLLILGDILPADRFPYGALVTVPGRHIMIILPIADEDVYEAMLALHRMTQELYESNPGPLSPAMYWWREEAIEAVSIVSDDDSIELRVSQALSDILDGLERDEESR